MKNNFLFERPKGRTVRVRYCACAVMCGIVTFGINLCASASSKTATTVLTSCKWILYVYSMFLLLFVNTYSNFESVSLLTL